MTDVLAIDPGAAHPGPACAYFRDTRLVYHEFAYFPVAEVDVVVVEKPEYHGDRTHAARVQDLMALCWAGARAAAYVAGRSGLREITEYTPAAWKGQEPKPIHHARLWAVLDASERAVLGGDATRAAIDKAIDAGALRRWPAMYNAYPRAFKMHNTLDAAALGAFHLGRLEKR